MFLEPLRRSCHHAVHENDGILANLPFQVLGPFCDFVLVLAVYQELLVELVKMWLDVWV